MSALSVPKSIKPCFDAIVGLTDAVCRTHLTEEHAALARELAAGGLPTPVLNLALFFGSIVAWVSDHLPHGDWHTNVPCRRSPSRRRCLGDIMAELDRTSGHIVWQCPVCGDNGLIHGWEDTLWNRQGGARAASSETPPTTSH
jgi:hypothetical protein